jgi:drug/metabolite transporter (DMT)-like permease
VNPVVAVLLGWLMAAEPMGVYTVIAMVVILVGVALVNSGQRDEHEPERTNGDTEAEEVAA